MLDSSALVRRKRRPYCKRSEDFLICYNNFSTYAINSESLLAIIQSVPGIKVNTSVFNFRADAELKTSYTHGSNSQRFRSYEFLKYSK